MENNVNFQRIQAAFFGLPGGRTAKHWAYLDTGLKTLCSGGSL